MIRCLIDGPSFDDVDTPYNDNLAGLATVIESVCRLARNNKILILPDDFVVVVSCNPTIIDPMSPGMHCAETQTIYLSGIYGIKDMIEFLCHELVHIEQTEIGWLSWDEDACALAWFGLPMQFTQTIADAEYRNLPWERDAYRRQDEVIRAVWNVIDKMEKPWPDDTAETKSEPHVSRLLH